MNRTLPRLALAILILLISYFIWQYCTPRLAPPTNGTHKLVWEQPKGNQDNPKRPRDLVVRFDPSTPTARIDSFDQALAANHPGVQVLPSCPCDPTLRHYANVDPWQILMSGDPTSGMIVRGGGATGDTLQVPGMVGFSPDFPITLDPGLAELLKPLNDSSTNLLRTRNFPNPDKRRVRVAVFDTGYLLNSDSEAGKFNLPQLELPAAGLKLDQVKADACNLQHNFTATSSAHPHDDNAATHGTRVSSLLISQLGDANVRVVPIKVLDSGGRGSLFNLMCALASVRNRQFDAINISLGFYAPTDSIPAQLLSDYLRRTNAFIFAAAGNANPDADAAETALGTSAGDLRFLDKRKIQFYPACLSTDSTLKLVTVTGVNRAGSGTPFTACSTQNVSNRYVDVAVGVENAQAECAILLRSEAMRGTSFATPILAGKILRGWSVGAPPPPTKKDLLSGLAAPTPTELAPWVATKKVLTYTPPF